MPKPYEGGKKCEECKMIMVKRAISGSGWRGRKEVWVCPNGHTQNVRQRGGWQGEGRKDRQN